MSSGPFDLTPPLILSDRDALTFNMPQKPSEWAWTFDGYVVWHVPGGQEPNRFHRFMLKLVFGIRWIKRNG